MPEYCQQRANANIAPVLRVVRCKKASYGALRVGTEEHHHQQERTAHMQTQQEPKKRPWSGLNWEWPKRAQMALEHLDGVNSVVDIGCGKMTLKSLLPEGVVYQGVDVAPRDETTILVNLNEEQLPDLQYDAATVLGVIEYLDDPAGFFQRLQQFDRVVITFNTYSVKDVLNKLGIGHRIPKGWKHRLRRSEVTALLEQNGFTIEAERYVRYAEYLWAARRV